MLRRRVMMKGGLPKHTVDLGLPSGLLWSTVNLGANKETDFGLYFSYGNVDGHEVGSYSFTPGNYSQTSGYNLNGNIPTNSTYDAAVAMLGDGWRMPTMADFAELIVNCTKGWVSDYQGSGIAGAVFTSNINGNKIFIVGSGYSDYTTSGGVPNIYLRESTYRYTARINANNSDYDFSYANNYTGIPIRPVFDK